MCLYHIELKAIISYIIMVGKSSPPFEKINKILWFVYIILNKGFFGENNDIVWRKMRVIWQKLLANSGCFDWSGKDIIGFLGSKLKEKGGVEMKKLRFEIHEYCKVF